MSGNNLAGDDVGFLFLVYLFYKLHICFCFFISAFLILVMGFKLAVSVQKTGKRPSIVFIVHNAAQPCWRELWKSLCCRPPAAVSVLMVVLIQNGWLPVEWAEGYTAGRGRGANDTTCLCFPCQFAFIAAIPRLSHGIWMQKLVQTDVEGGASEPPQPLLFFNIWFLTWNKCKNMKW